MPCSNRTKRFAWHQRWRAALSHAEQLAACYKPEAESCARKSPDDRGLHLAVMPPREMQELRTAEGARIIGVAVQRTLCALCVPRAGLYRARRALGALEVAGGPLVVPFFTLDSATRARLEPGAGRCE